MSSTASDRHTFAEVPDLPDAYSLTLPGRGTTYVYDTGVGRTDLTIVLLHGWTVTSALNFHAVFRNLASRTGARVIGMDQRGHGRGIKPKALFKLPDCADDVGALIETLRLQNVVVVGYSMGGAIAQWVAKRHGDKIRGAVFCATAAFFGMEQKKFGWWDVVMPAMATGLTVMPPAARQAILSRFVMIQRGEQVPNWMREDIGRGDPAMLVQAGIVLGKFDARPWLGKLTLPTAVVKTTRDQTVSVRRQQVLFDGLPNATLHLCDGDHRSAVTEPERFVDALVDAINSVSRRSRAVG